MNTQQLTVYRDTAPVLSNINIDIPEGKWTSIIGPNGAGKSSLLQAMVGLLKYSGSIFSNEVSLHSLSRKELAKRIAWLSQESAVPDELNSGLTVYDTVMLGRLPHQNWLHLPSSTDHDMVEKVLRQTGAWEIRLRPLQHLSGGERQRVLLARLMAVDADILLMDEPLTNLDPPHQAEFLDWQKIFLAQEKTVVTVLHEIHIALRSDHLIMLKKGKLHFSGPSQAPETHQALIELFDGRIYLEKLSNGWIALPC